MKRKQPGTSWSIHWWHRKKDVWRFSRAMVAFVCWGPWLKPPSGVKMFQIRIQVWLYNYTVVSLLGDDFSSKKTSFIRGSPARHAWFPEGSPNRSLLMVGYWIAIKKKTYNVSKAKSYTTHGLMVYTHNMVNLGMEMVDPIPLATGVSLPWRLVFSQVNSNHFTTQVLGCWTGENSRGFFRGKTSNPELGSHEIWCQTWQNPLGIILNILEPILSNFGIL
jgi:hypothetical protein